MNVILRQRPSVLRACLLLAVMFGVGGCQATPPRSPAEIQRDAEIEAYKQLGDLIAVAKENYIKPVTTGDLLTLALAGIEDTGIALPPRVHEIVQNSIRAVAATGSERAQLAAFTDGMSFLLGSQSASTPRLVRAAMTGMAGGLDPHSSYGYPGSAAASAYFPSVNSATAAFIGLALARTGRDTVVIEAIPNAPAALAGIKPGDVMVQLDGQPVAGSTLDEVVDRLRGPVGSSLQLVLQRPGQAVPLSLRINRQVVKYSGPEFTSNVRDGVAVIRPRPFNSTVLPKLRKALADSTVQTGGHLSGLVLDLRDNEGGLFDVAKEVARLLLQPGDTVVTLNGRNVDDNRAIKASDGSLPANMPIIVLVNGGTASGAELVAAALGNSRALLLGSQTYGMGTVQTVFPLRNGFFAAPGFVRLTTMQMFGPDGQSWQRRGLTPDIPIQLTPGTDNKHREDSLPGALPRPPNIGALSSLNPLRARLAQITPSLLQAPNPTDSTTDFAVEQALRAISLVQPPAATQ